MGRMEVASRASEKTMTKVIGEHMMAISKRNEPETYLEGNQTRYVFSLLVCR
jgi:hypothetical protein